jgi:spore maturation protein B
MKLLIFLSDFIMPLMIFYIVGFGLLMKKKIYDEFIKGATDGFKTVLNIMPTLIGLMMGVGILRASGFLDFLASLIGRVTTYINFPSELVPLAIVRLFSASAATGLALDIFKEYGTDSFIGLTASIIMGCTETVFYTMSVYFMAAKVTKTRWTLPGALLCTLSGIIASVFLAGMM